jgi:cbb3-type cytochrome oxidase subunit 3
MTEFIGVFSNGVILHIFKKNRKRNMEKEICVQMIYFYKLEKGKKNSVFPL